MSSDANNGGLQNASPFCYDPISNISLQFNGLAMYNSPWEMHKIINQLSTAGAGSYYASQIAQGSIAPFTSTPVKVYPLFIDFSRIRSACFDGHYNNVWRIGNNTLSLSFNTSSSALYTLYAVYHYNGVIECKAGQSRIYFD